MPKPNWQRAYVEMFQRTRSMMLDARRDGGPYLSDAEIDRRAWADSARYCERAINIANEAITLQS